MRTHRTQTTVGCSKDFPMKNGDTLFVRDRSGRVTDHYEVKDLSFLTALAPKGRVVYDAEKVSVER